jgi:hypothetical protein
MRSGFTNNFSNLEKSSPETNFIAILICESTLGKPF